MSAPHPDLVTLEVDGVRYRGWKSVKIRQSIRQGAIGFALSVREDRPDANGSPLSWRIQPGAAARVLIDDEIVCTGYVDAPVFRIGDTEHEVTVSGRSKSGDLVDSSTVVPNGRFPNSTAIDIITAICAPYGISVHVAENTDAPTRVANVRHSRSGAASAKKTSTKLAAGKQRIGNFEINQGEKAYATIERLCKLSGLLVFARPDGDIEIARAGQERYPFALPRIKTGQAKFDWSKRFSEYICKGQQSDPHFGATGASAVNWTLPDHVAWAKKASAHLAPSATVRDPSIGTYTSPSGKTNARYRPCIVRPEGPTGAADTLTRARWQMARDFGESISLTVTVPGFHAPDGGLWRVNRLVHVTDARLNLEHELLIAGVSFDKSERGTVTELELAPQDAYTPEPVGRTGVVAKGARKSTLWTLP
ncbi:phage baseplate assembly protein [Paraburkholderia tuberum]|uniref:Mu-like prophage tail protein gpP n=1 Tax=Paraburkholderia tuberum TaxID=157910 RepID=A0A1H1JTI5_9BURK|nr:hypothetical protein [Paraburkholderia tuberum]SDR52935.1 Mu-like prophage tail protein gpP [Paraburkholderia tuberum]